MRDEGKENIIRIRWAGALGYVRLGLGLGICKVGIRSLVGLG